VGSSRSLDFEERLEAHLRDNGLTVLRPKDLENIYRNAELFSLAEIVVGPHGAGLSNIVFCSQGTKVYELATQNWWNPAFSALAMEKSLSHRLILLDIENLEDNGSADAAWTSLQKALTL
jgi:capsular polysaccharide biosynthesis protein